MSRVKKGFWERGATDQKTKRTNGYLSVEVRGLVATSDGPGRYDSILCCQLRRQYSLNFLVPSIRPFDSLNNLLCKQKTPLKGFIVYIGVPGGSRTHGLPLRRRTLYPTELRKLKRHFCFRITIIISCRPFVKRIRFFTLRLSPSVVGKFSFSELTRGTFRCIMKKTKI